MKAVTREEAAILVQERMAEAQRLIDEAKVIAEPFGIQLELIGATFCPIDETWSVTRKWKGQDFEWSESSHCLEDA